MSVSDLLFKRETARPESDPTAGEKAISLAFLGAIVESSDDAIIGMTLDGQIISWNASASRIFGYRQDDVMGRPETILIPQDLQEEQLGLLEKVRRGERIDHFETARCARDGRRVEVSLSLSPVRDASGLVIAVATIARDIGTQKRAERASAQLAAIVEFSVDAIVSKDLNGIVQSWNDGARRIFGYSSEDIVGKPITTIIPAELHGEERRILERIRRGEHVDHFDTIRVGKDGRRIPISLTVSPVLDSRGMVIGASKIARDISERRRSEVAIRESRTQIAAEAAALAKLAEASVRLWKSPSLTEGLEEVLRTVIDLAGTRRGNVQLLNPLTNILSIVAQRGFDAEFLKVFEHLPADDKHAACGRALTSRAPVIIEDVDRDPDYAELRGVAAAAGYRAVVSLPLFGSDGSTLGAISTHFAEPHRPTLGELRRLEVYCRLAGDFIQRIRLEHSLRQNEQALREADRRKNEFLALLAHELRNPLAPIRYALATLRKPGTTEEQQAQAQGVVDRQVTHMSRLLDDLLDISRITRGTLELKRAPTELSSIVSHSVEAARPIIDSRRHTLNIELPKQPVRLDADPVRLAQVFSNLLINAAKYTAPEGQIDLIARLDRREVVVTVRDNGIGIADDMMPKLFTLFSQAQNALDRSEEGLGVGLALVRGLVNLHGGRVEARSTGLGKGSEFVVRLPATGAVAEAEAPAPRRPELPSVKSLQVLVVDDNRDAAESCATLLELSGHCVRTAHSGARAVEAAESFRPDVILLDIGLPDLNGYEVAKQIRASEWGRDVPLVAVTGWGQEDDRRRAFEAGFDHHLTKPVPPEAVESLIKSLGSGSS